MIIRTVEGRKAPAARGRRLASGESLFTEGRGSLAVIVFPDRTRLAVGADSILTCTRPGKGKRVTVKQGRLLVEVTRQPDYQPIVITTPHAEVVVLGTRFTLEVQAKSTRIEVREGEVKLTRRADRLSIRVSGGQYAVAARGLPLAAKWMRVRAGLQVLYLFNERGGDTVHDVSGVGAPLNLKISDRRAVRWIAGGLRVHSSVLIASRGAARKVIRACRAAGEITIEAWSRPARRAQNGPARIVTLSGDTMQRDFTLGQGVYGGPSNVYDVRLRTTTTEKNGMPSLTSPRGSLKTRLTHVLYTRSRRAGVRLYLDGVATALGRSNYPDKRRDVTRLEGAPGGDFSNWDAACRLALANEVTKDLPWLGEFHLVAIYARALAAGEVKRNFLSRSAP